MQSSSWKQKGLMPPQASRGNTIIQHVNIKTHTKQVLRGANGATWGMDRDKAAETEEHATHFPREIFKLLNTFLP